ncbi:MAG: hypothetical protein K6G64_04750 [Eubacterium sp.]|nr:hypothetical protein [Eubacterium sp.]
MRCKKILKRLVVSMVIACCILVATQGVSAKTKNSKDIRNLQKIISVQKKRGAKISSDINNKKQYGWNKKTGRLERITWKKKKLKGKISFNSLSGLEAINVCDNKITKISVDKVKKLSEFDCSYNKITKISVNKLKNLSELDCSYNKISALHIEGVEMLEFFSCNNNGMKTLELKNLGYIRVDCSHNKLKSLDFEDVCLGYLWCDHNQLKQLPKDAESVDNILDCSFNKIKTLRVCSHFIWILRCDHNQLTSLTVENPSEEFSELYCQSNKLTSIDLTGQNKLEKLVCDKSLIVKGLKKGVKVKRK